MKRIAMTVGFAMAATFGVGMPAAELFRDGYGAEVRQVVLAVGDLSAAEGCYFAGDTQSDARGCRLYAVKVAADGEVRADQQLADASVGRAWQPSVAGQSLALLHEWVFLIDIANPAQPIFQDMTSAIEDHLSLLPNAMTGFTASCRR